MPGNVLIVAHGRRGSGKTHLINRIKAGLEQAGFIVKESEVNNGESLEVSEFIDGQGDFATQIKRY